MFTCLLRLYSKVRRCWRNPRSPRCQHRQRQTNCRIQRKYVTVLRSIYPPDNTRLVHTSQNVHLRANAYTKRRYAHVKVYHTAWLARSSNPSDSVHKLYHKQDTSNYPIQLQFFLFTHNKTTHFSITKWRLTNSFWSAVYLPRIFFPNRIGHIAVFIPLFTFCSPVVVMSYVFFSRIEKSSTVIFHCYEMSVPVNPYEILRSYKVHACITRERGKFVQSMLSSKNIFWMVSWSKYWHKYKQETHQMR